MVVAARDLALPLLVFGVAIVANGEDAMNLEKMLVPGCLDSSVAVVVVEVSAAAIVVGVVGTSTSTSSLGSSL